MIESVNKYQISDIFDFGRNLKYVIPKFQREYTWSKKNWEDLFNDLDENDAGHFLGSIICINRSKDALGMASLEVIDGQQRLTTISLLYAAIYERIIKEERADDDYITEKSNLKYRLLIKGGKDLLKIEPSYQNKNFEDYKAILGEVGLYTNPPKTNNLGNRRMYKTYQYFKNRIDELDYDKIINLLNKVNSALIVKIEVNNAADAFILFESLNDRGIPLSAIDLIKNNILSALEKKKIKSLNDAAENWRVMTDSLQDYSIQERFLRQYYNAFKYKNDIGITGISKATRSTLIKIYEKLIEKNPEYIFHELIDKAKIYAIFDNPMRENASKYYEGLTDLKNIGAAPSYIFLLYLFAEHSKNIELLENTISFLVKYFVRRNLTDFPNTRNLDQIFMDLIELCEKTNSNLNPKLVIDYLKRPEHFSNGDDFKKKLEGDIYEDNDTVTRFVLSKIEQVHQTKEIFTDLWKRDNSDKFIWTIEHVFPEGKNIPKEWVEMIAEGNIEKAKEFQEEWVHKLGNLTLTGYNSNLSNLSFEKKRDRKGANGNYIGYMNGLYLNEELASKKFWTIDDIKKRTEKLVNASLGLFN